MQQLLTNSELTLNKRIWGHKDLLTSSPPSRPIYCNIAVGKAGEPEMQIERRQGQYRQSWLRRISSPGQRRSSSYIYWTACLEFIAGPSVKLFLNKRPAHHLSKKDVERTSPNLHLVRPSHDGWITEKSFIASSLSQLRLRQVGGRCNPKHRPRCPSIPR